MGETKTIFEDKQILITGGCGSIGSEIVRQLLRHAPYRVKVFSNDETSQFYLQEELKEHKNVRYLLGDIRDKDRLERAVEDMDIIFHAAALKHVPACEYNPFEAVKTNVIGTQNLLEVALNEEVDKVIFISTDKASNPINTLGATKLLAEKLVFAANYYKGVRKTVFSSLRFGNVFNSEGSVAPLFKRQIQKGGPVSITDPNMSRFMMSMNQAVNLVFKATEMAQGGEVFIFKMPAFRLGDLVEVMIEKLAPKYGYKSEEIRTETIGIRAGEKLYEELMTEEESRWAQETESMFIVQPPVELPNIILKSSGEVISSPLSLDKSQQTQLKRIDSRHARLLTKEEIGKILMETQ